MYQANCFFFKETTGRVRYYPSDRTTTTWHLKAACAYRAMVSRQSRRRTIPQTSLLTATWQPSGTLYPFLGSWFPFLEIANPQKKGALIRSWLLGYQGKYGLTPEAAEGGWMTSPWQKHAHRNGAWYLGDEMNPKRVYGSYTLIELW